MVRLLTVVLTLAATCSCAYAAAVVDVQFGWAGHWRPETWTPAFVTAQARSPQGVIFEWYVPRPGREAMVMRQEVTLNIRAETFVGLLPVGPDPAGITLRVSDPMTGRTLARWPDEPRSPDELAELQVRDQLLVIVAGEAPALPLLERERFVRADVPLEHLPITPVGLEGVDLLVLSRPQLARLSHDRQRAIVRWVEAGGRVLWSPGAEALPADAPLMTLAPGPIDGREQVTVEGRATSYVRVAGVEGEELITPVRRGEGVAHFAHIAVEHLPAETLEDLGLVVPEERELPRPEREVIEEVAERASSKARGGLALLAIAAIVGPVDWLILRRTGRRVRRWWTLPGWLLMVVIVLLQLPRAPQTPILADAGETRSHDGRVVMREGVFASAGMAVGQLPPQRSADDALASYREVGPTWWKTVGFDRTEGPFRDVVVRLTDLGVFSEGEPEVLGEAAAYPPTVIHWD